MNEKPIFVQLIEMIEDNIISGVWDEGELIISSTQICKLYNVNPATAMRALQELAASGVLVKDRGIGMRVAKGARAQTASNRKNVVLNEMLEGLVSGAKKLGISKQDLRAMLEKKYEESKDD